MPSTSQWTCSVCGRTLLRKNLYTHLRAVHCFSTEDVSKIKEGIYREAGIAMVSCPLCCANVSSYDGLAKHCEREHSEDGANGRPQNYTTLSLSFNNEQEYERWLERESKRTCTSFYKARTTVSTTSKKIRLVCNRSGVYTTTSTKKASKSRRDVRHCSCHLNVDYHSDGAVSIKGCLGHVGHDLDPALLRFTPKERDYLKRLVEEYPFDYVIHRLRKEDPTKMSKLSFVIRSDLNNLVAKYKLKPRWRRSGDFSQLQSPELTLPQSSGDTTPEKDVFLDATTTINLEQERREARYKTLDAIKSASAVVEAAASSLAETDTEEAQIKLEEIHAQLQLAADVWRPISSKSTLVTCSEMEQVEGNPDLAKISAPVWQNNEASPSGAFTKKHRNWLDEFHVGARSTRLRNLPSID